MFGSAALSLAYVAAGHIEAYQEESIAIWDVAAGLALVEAAGGHFVKRPRIGKEYFVDVFAWNGFFDLNVLEKRETDAV